MKNVKFLFVLLLSFTYVLSIAQVDFITAKEFMKIKSDKNLVIIDADKSKTYEVNHIKDAISIPHAAMNKEKVSDLDGLLLNDADLAKVLGNKGVSETNSIVVYDGGSYKYSCRVYWTLKYLGVKDVKILHKDMSMWEKAEVPLTRITTKTKAVTFTPNIDKSVIAYIDDVKNAKGNDNVILVDVRTPEEFDGSSDKSEGNIPGSININYKDLLTEDTKAFKSAEELEIIARQYGLTPDKEIFFYCRTGVRGTVSYVAFKNILGYPNVKVYDGSYSEWITKYDVEK